MSLESQDSVRARAIEWHIRLRDGDDATWEAFAEWLAADARHAEAYDVVEAADEALDPLLAHVVIHEGANDTDDVEVPIDAPARRGWRWGIAGGAIAASIAFAAILVPQSSTRYEVVTAPGERRVVALDEATEVTLNGGTRMTFDRDNPRFAALVAGEAYFRVHHDESNPFRLQVGDNIVEDAGTIFNVVHAPGEVRVAVAEGKVVYNPGARAVSLDAGQALVDRNSAKQVEVTEVPPIAVGSWQSGSLTYAAAPLSRVADDVGRTLGVRIQVAPSIANRPFSGTIILDGSGVDQFGRLGPALDVTLVRQSDGWIMKARSGRP